MAKGNGPEEWPRRMAEGERTKEPMKVYALILTLVLLLLAGCDAPPPSTGGTALPPPAPTLASTATPTQAAPVGPLPSGVQSVLGLYAQSVALPLDALQVVSYEAVEFPDGCLGAASPGEMCTAAITPGYIIVVNANGAQSTIHSNLEGTFFRIP